MRSSARCNGSSCTIGVDFKSNPAVPAAASDRGGSAPIAPLEGGKGRDALEGIEEAPPPWGRDVLEVTFAETLGGS